MFTICVEQSFLRRKNTFQPLNTYHYSSAIYYSFIARNYITDNNAS
ncbi:hypothetical protein JCM19235_4063 [Vibrio maritimus]|uniref:Uncharacterized protein n=2 Tax=Vibrio TaxID=662 RepID=A0A090RZ84_9VIBR|nr:hypothetical protein JCM19235_4063 [Vibrio maritimus]GAL31043.1 hypothetical protein JCM19239_4129 [Vibrio variabilis]